MLSHIERLLRHLEVSPDAVLRQLIVLESSFAMSRVTFDLHEPRDWNPILQIPFCYRGYTSGALLSAQYDGRYQAAHQIVELSHEMLHILLWESFFVGDLCPTQNQFVAMSRLFEGYAYWFADIVLTERLRASSRKHEMLFSRHSLTSINFHPRVAFRELGLLTTRRSRRSISIPSPGKLDGPEDFALIGIWGRCSTRSRASTRGRRFILPDCMARSTHQVSSVNSGRGFARYLVFHVSSINVTGVRKPRNVSFGTGRCLRASSRRRRRCAL